MKKNAYKVSVFLVAFTLLVGAFVVLNNPIFSLTANASEKYVDGYFTYTVDENENAQITVCSYSASGNIDIPSTINGYSVTSIGEYAFFDCSKITAITIPSSVALIENQAFTRCTGLTSVVILDGVKEIGYGAFAGCTKLKSVVIPDSVEFIGNSVFSNCFMLSEIKLPASGTSIGKDFLDETAYYKSTDNWQNGSLYIDGYLIEANPDAEGLFSVDSGTKYIADYAFENNSKITSVELPDSVIKIGNSAFSGCTAIQKISIPDKVETINPFTFCNCRALVDVTVGTRVKTIGNAAFSGCTALKTVVLPGNIITIENNAFSGCTSLESVSFEKSLKSIDDEAFYYCESLKNVFFNGKKSEWEQVSVGAFNENLLNADFDFAHTFGEWKITKDATPFEEGVEERICSECSEPETRKTPKTTPLPNTDYPVGDYTVTVSEQGEVTIVDYSSNPKTRELDIPSDFGGYPVKAIGEHAFWHCSMLKSITIPSSVTDIGNAAFDDCYKLEEVNLPYGITEIKQGTFSSCEKLEKIEIPDSVTKIGPWAFQYCVSLTEINIPSSVTEIYSGAFLGCSGLTVVTIPDTVTYLGYWVFEDCENLEEIHMPKSKKELSISDYKGCTSLKKIYLPNTIQSVNGKGFSEELICYFLGTEKDWTEVKTSDIAFTVVFSCSPDHTYASEWTVIDEGNYYNEPGTKENLCTVCERILHKRFIKITKEKVSLTYKNSTYLYVNSEEPVKWESSDESVVAFGRDNAGQQIVAVGAGTATVTATTMLDGEEVTLSCEVTVTYSWWQWIIRILLLGFLWY